MMRAWSRLFAPADMAEGAEKSVVRDFPLVPPAYRLGPDRPQPEAGWLRSARVYRAKTGRLARVQIEAWWRYPKGRWGAPSRHLVRWATHLDGHGEQFHCLTNESCFYRAPKLCGEMILVEAFLAAPVANLETTIYRLRTLAEEVQKYIPFLPPLSIEERAAARSLMVGADISQLANLLNITPASARAMVQRLERRFNVSGREALMRMLWRAYQRNRQYFQESMQ